jgi:tyrosyl-tRNA synthetase
MVGGAEFIRKSDGTTVSVLATPLITKSDGTKMGKSEGGAVWLDPKMMSPYAFHQFWLNTADADVIHYLKVFTFRSQAEIQALQDAVTLRPGAREAQRTLADDVTELVHGPSALADAKYAAEALFGRGDLAELGPDTLAAVVKELPSTIATIGDPLIDLAVTSGLAQSRGAARRSVLEGGLYLNNARVTDPAATLAEADFLAGRHVVLRRGKKTLAAATRL